MTTRHPFDRLARDYWWLEAVTFGTLLHRCRTAHLTRLAGARRALVVGDGDGRFLESLLRAHPTVAIDALDISPGMTAAARRRTRFAAGRVRFAVGDVRTAPLGGGYDLVVTNFLLDCFPPDQLAAVVGRLAAATTADARWLVGDFELPPGRPWWARAALAGMYLAFRGVARLSARKLADPGPLLAAHGFRPAVGASWLGGFLASRLWQRG